MSQASRSDSRSASAALSRRTVFAGAGAAGALAAVAVVAPRIEPTASQALASTQPEADADGRYQLTEHVNRYYQTARV